MKDNIKKLGAPDIISLILSAAFLLGILSVFSPCARGGDGNWMHCHAAGVAVTCGAAVTAILTLARIWIFQPESRWIPDVMMIISAGLTALFPGYIFELCMMPQMRCRMIMAPAVRIFSVVIILAAAADILYRMKYKPKYKTAGGAESGKDGN